MSVKSLACEYSRFLALATGVSQTLKTLRIYEVKLRDHCGNEALLDQLQKGKIKTGNDSKGQKASLPQL